MKLTVVACISALFVLTPQNVHGRLGKEEGSNRNLARGGRKGPPARVRGESPRTSQGQAKKDEGEEAPQKVSRGQAKKVERDQADSQGRKPPSWVKDFEPVELVEPTEVIDSPDFQEVLTSYRALLKHSNEKIKAEKEELEAANAEDRAATDEATALKEENGASDNTQKAAAQEKLVAARLAKQEAKEYVKEAREKTRALEATDESLHAAFAENQEKYRVKLQERAAKAAQDTKEEVEKEKKEGRNQDKALWRATREAAIESVKKDKDELRKEGIEYRRVCEQIEKAENRLSAARAVKVMRTEARLTKLEAMEMPVAVREVAVQDLEEQIGEDKIWAELSEAEAIGAKKECEAVTSSQVFLSDRVFTVLEDIKERELVRVDISDAREKFMQELEEKKAADKAVADAAKEKANAESDKDKQAAQLRLQGLQEKADSKAILVEAASDKLRDVQTKRLEIDLNLIEQATANKDDEKKEVLTPEERQAILTLDEVLLSQATDGSEEDKKSVKAVEVSLQQAAATLEEKLEQQEAVYAQIKDELEGSAGDVQTQQIPDELRAAQLALEETMKQQGMLQSDQEIVLQAQIEIPQAENYEIDLVKISHIQEEEYEKEDSAKDEED